MVKPIIILSNQTDASYPEDPAIREYLVKANTKLDEVVEKVKKYLR